MQNHLSKPEDLMLQNATLLRKSAPGPPNSSDEDVSCTAPATENASLKILFKCPTPAIVCGNATKTSRFAHLSLAPATQNDIWTSKSGAKMWCLDVLCTFWLRNVLRATFSTSQLPKVVRTWCALYILTSKCASPPRRALFRHLNFQKCSRPGVLHFDFEMCFGPPRRALFRHLNFQKCSRPGVLHFDFEMCFGPQRRALFRHLNFQKCSEREVFLAFSLAHVLLATTACAFSTSQLPKVVRSWCALHILTWKCASRHNDVQFFISLLARWLCTRCFSEPTFRPSRGTNHWKNTVFRDFPTFSRTCIFFLLTLSLLWSSLFYSSLLSDSSHLCFSSVHIVGSLTSKLPSIILNLKSHEIPGMPRKSAGRRLCRHVLKTDLTKEKETMWGWIILATKSSSNLSSCSILPSGNQTWLGKDTRFMWK